MTAERFRESCRGRRAPVHQPGDRQLDDAAADRLPVDLHETVVPLGPPEPRLREPGLRGRGPRAETPCGFVFARPITGPSTEPDSRALDSRDEPRRLRPRDAPQRNLRRDPARQPHGRSDLRRRGPVPGDATTIRAATGKAPPCRRSTTGSSRRSSPTGAARPPRSRLGGQTRRSRRCAPRPSSLFARVFPARALGVEGPAQLRDASLLARPASTSSRWSCSCTETRSRSRPRSRRATSSGRSTASRSGSGTCAHLSGCDLRPARARHDLRRDSRRPARVVRAASGMFLDDAGVGTRAVDADEALGFVDTELRHATLYARGRRRRPSGVERAARAVRHPRRVCAAPMSAVRCPPSRRRPSRPKRSSPSGGGGTRKSESTGSSASTRARSASSSSSSSGGTSSFGGSSSSWSGSSSSCSGTPRTLWARVRRAAAILRRPRRALSRARTYARDASGARTPGRL